MSIKVEQIKDLCVCFALQSHFLGVSFTEMSVMTNLSFIFSPLSVLKSSVILGLRYSLPGG